MEYNEEESTQIVNVPGSDSVDISISYDYNGIINFIILILIFLLAKLVFTRFLMASKKGIEPGSENISYAISVFSLFVSLSIILTSVIYGDIPSNLYESVTKLLVYSALGIALLITSGLIFDRIALTKISINNEISNGNKAAALVDAGNFIASALIIASILKWYEFKSLAHIVAILWMYVASQVILTIATIIKKAGKYSAGFEQQITQQNIAAAIDFSGRRIGTALAITAAASVLPYQEGYNQFDILMYWTFIAAIMVVFLNIFSWIASRIIFWSRNITNDLIENDTSTALFDAAIYVSFGIILAGILM